jgi:energy-converting hydrogenase Eha subunit G
MNPLGVALLIVGGSVFATIVIYYLIDNRMTGILYRARKRVLFPILLGAWALWVTGMFVV